MGWEIGLMWVGVGIWAFLLFGLPGVLKVRSNNKVKVAEATARTEEARLERTRLDIEHDKWQAERQARA